MEASFSANCKGNQEQKITMTIHDGDSIKVPKLGWLAKYKYMKIGLHTVIWEIFSQLIWKKMERTPMVRFNLVALASIFWKIDQDIDMVFCNVFIFTISVVENQTLNGD